MHKTVWGGCLCSFHAFHVCFDLLYMLLYLSSFVYVVIMFYFHGFQACMLSVVVFWHLHDWQSCMLSVLWCFCWWHPPRIIISAYIQQNGNVEAKINHTLTMNHVYHQNIKLIPGPCFELWVGCVWSFHGCHGTIMFLISFIKFYLSFPLCLWGDDWHLQNVNVNDL
jgi:hypothetical protein